MRVIKKKGREGSRRTKKKMGRGKVIREENQRGEPFSSASFFFLASAPASPPDASTVFHFFFAGAAW